MKKRIIAVAALMCVLAASNAAYAMENVTAHYDIDTDTVTIAGTHDAKTGITILVPANESNKSIFPDDITAEGSIFDKIKIFGELKSDDEGNFSKTFKMSPSSENGDYTAYVSANSEEDAQTVKFSYVNPSTVASYLSEISTADKDNVLSKIEAYASVLELDLSKMPTAEADKTETAHLFADTIRKQKTYTKVADLQTDLEKAEVLRQFNALADAASVKANLAETAEALGIDLTVYNGVGNTATRSAKQDAICAGIFSLLPITDIDVFTANLQNLCFTTDITAPEDWASLQTMATTTYKAQLTGITDTIWTRYANLDGAQIFKEVYQSSYQNTSTFETLFTAKVNEKTFPATVTGGSTNKSNNVSIAVPTSPTTPAQGTEVANKDKFDDLKEAEWAKSDIEKLAEKGVMSGDGTGNVYPNRTITREEFITIAAKSFDLTSDGTQSAFTDVVEGAWYEEFVKAAYEAGIISGISETEFGIGSEITRQDMAVILCRLAEKFGVVMEESEEEFTDMQDVADYAKRAVLCMKKSGIITGMEDGSFRPNEKATRAQTAVMINRLLELM